MTPEQSAQVTIWEHKAAEGTLTREDCAAYILLLRDKRMGAAYSAASKRKKIAAEMSDDDLLKDFE